MYESRLGVSVRHLKKLELFLSFAEGLGGMSTCKRRSVGCVITNRTLTQVFSVGYNGPPKGEDNDGCRDESGKCGCVHAEANALIKLHTDLTNLTLLTTLSPCESCTGLIINSESIGRVVYGEVYEDAPLALLQNAFITSFQLEDGNDDD